MKKKLSRILGVGLTLALLLSLVVGAIPAIAISTPTVSQTNNTISQTSTYTILFQIQTGLTGGGGGDQIVVTFPTGTTFEGGFTNTDVTVGSTSGIGVVALPTGVSNAATTAANVVTITPQANIGAGATVQLVIGNAGANHEVVNPAAPGDSYTLSVATQTAAAVPIEAAATSGTFTLVVPTIPPVPGVVSGYNTAGVLLYQNAGNVINAALGTAGVTQVVIGAGTYDEDVAVGAGQSIEAKAGEAVTIQDVNLAGGGGSVSLNGAGASATGLTIVGSTTTGFAVNLNAAGGTSVTNCTIGGAAVNAVRITAGAALTPAVSSGNTITAAAGFSGIITMGTPAVGTSTGDSITLAGATSTGITVVATDTLTVSGATITGASGTGINSAGTTTVSGSSLSNLETGITIGGGTATITGNTLTACGDATTGLENPTIDVTALPTAVNIQGNTITDSPHEILQIAGVGSALVTYMNFNSILNAAVGIDNQDAGNTVDCTNNWWGASTGPAVTSTATIVKTTPFLRADVSSGTIYPGVATTGTNATVGVIVADSSALGPFAWTNAGVALYSENPGTAEPPGEVVKYLDVYVNPNVASTSIAITVLGIQSSAAQVYAWSAAQGLWVLCSNQTVDLFQGGVVVTITAATTPTLANLAAMEFALVEPALAPLGAIAGTSLKPEIAGTDVSINPTFTWAAVAGADSYDFALAEELGQDDPFAILEYADTASINAHVCKKTLKYDTTYNWRVRPSRVTGIEEVAPGDVREIIEKGAWTVGLFVTGSEPEEEAEPIVVEEVTPPAPQITLNPTPVTVNVPDANVEVIPDTLLYVIIGVGAVLVIAVIVLIVRTRRV
jgi:hypothetical protein